MITKADVLAVAPELSSVDDASWTVLIGFAYAQLEPTVWGSFLDMGATYLVAHLATMGPKRASGAAGPVQSQSVGQVSVSYAVMAQVSGATASTAYGQEFERLRRGLHDARFPVIA